MKHIKKYRRLLSKKEQESLKSKARSKAKHILQKKHIEEYFIIYTPIYKKLRREYFKQITKKNANSDYKTY